MQLTLVARFSRITVFQYFILTTIWKFSLQNYRNPYFLTCLTFSESQIISNFASCRFHMHFSHVSDLVWSSMADPSACHCRHIQRNHSPKTCGSQRQLLAKNRKSIPLELKQTLVITFHHSFFPTTVGFIFSPLQTAFSITPGILELLIRSGAACEILLLHFKQVHASSI